MSLPPTSNTRVRGPAQAMFFHILISIGLIVRRSHICHRRPLVFIQTSMDFLIILETLHLKEIHPHRSYHFVLPRIEFPDWR